MAAISFPTAADTPSRTTYTSNPWTDPSGNQWLWSAAKERWSPISETVENAVTDNNTNAVSSNAVFDALELKAPLSGATFTGPITATAITGTTGTFSGNISPTVTNTQSFGSTGLNWNTIWTRNVRSDSGSLILNDGNATITITSGTLALGNRKLTALRGLEFQVDNTYDIGATSTTLRPRDLFLARNAGIGGNLTATGTVTAGGTNTWTGSTFSGTQAFTGAVSVTDATASTTTTTGALKVAGGLGVVGAVTAGARVTATRGTVGVGTVYTNFGLTDIAGTSTDFLSRFVVGDSITFETTKGPETKQIGAIHSDTSMTTFPFSWPSASGAEAYTHTTASATMNPSGAITGTRGTFSGPVSVSGLTITGTPLPIASGGTGGATASAARTALGSKAVGDLLFQAETVADVVTTVGGVVKTEIFNTSGTWTKAPGAKLLKIIVVGGGGGGAGGSTGAAGTNRRGGGGGSGGGVVEVEVFATDLPDSLPVTVGAGAPGGGGYGGNGGTSSFGSYFGRGGFQGIPGGGGGGQVYSASVTVGHTGVPGATGGLPTGGFNTLNKRFGVSGGGGGGGITDANVRGAGGTTSLQEGSALDAAAAYAPQFPAATTAIGQAGGAGVKLHVLGFGGGGGGAAGDTAGTINGGAGGTGVAGGGGGGGGSATSPATAGAGGPGGAGFVLIQTYF